jgi:hypothetical protein
MALNSNHSLTQIQIYITIIIVGVHNTDSHYVDTIPVVQEQPYDQYDIAHNTGTIPVVQEQHYDQYDIAHCVETSLLTNMI